jgi:hypothetical protein
MLETSKPICQSCGAPIHQDSKKGREKDGSLSPIYCNECFQFGGFIDNKMTAEKMAAQVRKKILERHYPRYLADLLSERTYSLKRWEGSRTAQPALHE